jgi:putative transposase
MSQLYQSLSHSRWHCTYHVVFVPKRRRKKLLGEIRRARGPMFPELARQQACRLIKGHVMPEHIPLCIAVPPQPAVASVIGFLQGNRAMAMARQVEGRDRHFTGAHCWARGYAVSTVGFELEHVKASIRDHEGPDDHGRFSAAKPGYWHLAAFEAALLIKPPALRGVSDSNR